MPTFHQIAKEIRNRYTIVFAPDPTLDRQKYPTRSLRVIATAAGHKHLAVRCRTSYSLKPFAQLLAGLPEKRKN